MRLECVEMVLNISTPNKIVATDNMANVCKFKKVIFKSKE